MRPLYQDMIHVCRVVPDGQVAARVEQSKDFLPIGETDDARRRYRAAMYAKCYLPWELFRAK